MSKNATSRPLATGTGGYLTKPEADTMVEKANSKAHIHALHSGHSGGAVCWRLFSLSPLSPIPSFVFSLSPLLLSPFCVQKPIWGSARQESSHTDGMGGIWVNCGLWARVKHLYCAQKPRNRSSGEAKTQKPTKCNVALK